MLTIDPFWVKLRVLTFGGHICPPPMLNRVKMHFPYLKGHTKSASVIRVFLTSTLCASFSSVDKKVRTSSNKIDWWNCQVRVLLEQWSDLLPQHAGE